MYQVDDVVQFGCFECQDLFVVVQCECWYCVGLDVFVFVGGYVVFGEYVVMFFVGQ